MNVLHHICGSRGYLWSEPIVENDTEAVLVVSVDDFVGLLICDSTCLGYAEPIGSGPEVLPEN